MVDVVELTLPISDRSDPALSFITRSAGLGLDGSEQIISPLTALWRWRVVIPIRTKEDARGIRIVKSRLRGRFNYLMTRVCDQYRITRRDIGLAPLSRDVTHSDTALFSDYYGYQKSQPTSAIMESAPLNSSSLVIRASDMAGYMTAGVFFSVNYFLYQIDAWELSGGGETYSLQISPPLRQSVSTEDYVDFDAKCYWRLASDDAGSLDLQIGRFGSVTLDLVEPVRS